MDVYIQSFKSKQSFSESQFSHSDGVIVFGRSHSHGVAIFITQIAMLIGHWSLRWVVINLPLRSWQVNAFKKTYINFLLFLKQKSFPSLAPPQRSISINWIPHSEFFFFKLQILSWPNHTSFLLEKILQEHMKTSFIIVTVFYGRGEFRKFFLSSVICFVKYLILLCSLK